MSAIQEDLFSHVPPLSRVDQVAAGMSHKSAGETEITGAVKDIKGKARQRQQVLRIIVAAGSNGITRAEISELYEIGIQSVTGRVWECIHRFDPPLVYVSGKRGGGGKLFATERGKRAAS